MTKPRLVANQLLWIRGEVICKAQRNAISETRALQESGAEIHFLKSANDKEGLKRLKHLLWKKDTHVVLSWLHPAELRALQPLFRDRKNFSFLNDDWWIQPYWFMREAEFLLFRKYHGIAVRLGCSPFLSGGKPPLIMDPRPQFSKYGLIGALLRPVALATAPVVNLWNWWRRHDEKIDPSKLLYFPFAIDPANVPLGSEKPRYDFANTGGACGIWYMRDPYAPFQHTFANLYEDRKRLVDAIAQFENNPFTFYDCRRDGVNVPYNQYILKNQQSRYLVASGGLQDTTVPKYLEYACVGTPMIGRGLPFDYPWLDDCLFPVDMMHLTPAKTKSLLNEALDRYPIMRQNCLNWRDKLLKLYDIHTLLDLVQAQSEGKPIPQEYLKVDVRQTGNTAISK